MISSPSTIIAVLFLLFSTGFSRELIGSTTTGDSFASPPSLFEEGGGGIAREMIELDYDYPGPNTNKRSGFTVPSPGSVAPAPQP